MMWNINFVHYLPFHGVSSSVVLLVVRIEQVRCLHPTKIR
jgi:hypothetical protein